MVRGFLLCLLLLSPGALSQETCDRGAFVLAIDIGHTPKKAGAVSARGRSEYAFNKVLAGELLQAVRKQGFRRAFLINPQGREIGLRDRTKLAAQGKADLLLSIHHDSVQRTYLSYWKVNGQTRHYSDSFRGYSLFYSAKNPHAEASLRFAYHLGCALRTQDLNPTLHHAETIPGENRTLLDSDKGIYQFDNLVVLKTATMPAVLFEAGVIVHREEEALLRMPSHRSKLIYAVVTALQSYCMSVQSMTTEIDALPILPNEQPTE